MILVTGGTGFVGRALIAHLVASGQQVRTLLRPSKKSPQLPRGITIEAAVCSLLDERGLRAAMKDVDAIFHLAGTERQSSSAELEAVDVLGTQSLVRAAAQAGVRRIIYLSHLGADKASAYPVLRAKALAESAIQQSGMEYTIFRTATVFGPGDQFTTGLARLLRVSPGFFLIPGEGTTLLQPIWIEDLINILEITLDTDEYNQQVISIGGGETIMFRDAVRMVSEQIGIQRSLVSVNPPYLRMIGLFLEQFSRFPVSLFWLDYLAADRTAPLDTVPRMFGILPVRFHTNLGYLRVPQKVTSRMKGKRK